tara:strand:+ start:12202 stop:12372 length:171 start_codon:yes stop_codon:yes gene_type:complete
LVSGVRLVHKKTFVLQDEILAVRAVVTQHRDGEQVTRKVLVAQAFDPNESSIPAGD